MPKFAVDLTDITPETAAPTINAAMQHIIATVVFIARTLPPLI